ncbi:MAG: inositol monophosphatase, partial [bacterium]|nr:inositol monophosphatase [bacterium]
FAMFSRFFPGAKDVLGQVEEALVERLIGPVQEGKARLFEDQYISTGGQFYELMAGHDRFNADLRPNLEQVMRSRGQALGICCHPYDVCTELIAREMGVVVTDPEGNPLDVCLDTTSPVAWVGYANNRLHERIEPVLQAVLREYGLI